jgi:putative hemin transport protein
MTLMTTTTIDLQEAWDDYRTDHPETRHRDAAADLGVTEAELVAAACGLESIRLTGDWGALLQELEPLGPLMALTRNDAAVHEKTGVYRNVELHDTHQMGQVLADQIDLRLFLDRWKYGFAVALRKGGGHVLRGFQFFDKHGTAVHKIYLRGGSDEAAYDALVEKYRTGEDAPALAVEPATESPATPDAKIDTEAFLEGWRDLEDTHDFFPLLRKHNVGRAQALRIGEDEFTRRVGLKSHRHVLETVRDEAVPIMVFVRSPGTVQIHTGPVERLHDSGDWFNVLDDGFNLHLREDLIDEAWVVQKPTADGTVTSLELYDADGNALTKFFGERKPGRPEREDWRAVVNGLGRENGAA